MTVITLEGIQHFGNREIAMMRELLEHWGKGNTSELASRRFGDLTAVGLNQNSGYVWLQDDDYNALMIHNDQLDLHLFTPHHGHEGFLDELLEEHSPDDLNADDVEYLRDCIEDAGLDNDELPTAWQVVEE